MYIRVCVSIPETATKTNHLDTLILSEYGNNVKSLVSSKIMNIYVNIV